MFNKKGEPGAKPPRKGEPRGKAQYQYEYIAKVETPTENKFDDNKELKNNEGNRDNGVQKFEKKQNKNIPQEDNGQYKNDYEEYDYQEQNPRGRGGFRRGDYRSNRGGNYRSNRGGRGNYYDYSDNYRKEFQDEQFKNEEYNYKFQDGNKPYQKSYNAKNESEIYGYDANNENYQIGRGERGGRRRNDLDNRGYKYYGNRNQNWKNDNDKYNQKETLVTSKPNKIDDYPELDDSQRKINGDQRKYQQNKIYENNEAKQSQKSGDVEAKNYEETYNENKGDQKPSKQKRGKNPLSFKNNKPKEKIEETKMDEYDNKESTVIDVEDKNTGVCRMESLIISIKSKKIDCPICCQLIHKDQPTWNCRSCYHIFHLNCVCKWIETNNQDVFKSKTIKNEDKSFYWRCPSCNYSYSEKMPNYYCFCLKTKNPHFDHDLLPHSCGEICEKSRGVTCDHPCLLYCHPGPCPPCKKAGKIINCCCGKNKEMVRCGAESKIVLCNQICEKFKNCGEHKCDRVCHAGNCNECEYKLEGLCFCGKEKKEITCGKAEYSCKNICNKPINCGKHNCREICHKGPCPECPTLPDKIKTCPCGNMKLITLLGVEKMESCDSKIPVCGGPCKKLLPCKKHRCKSSCHLGDCPDCTEQVEQECRCGDSNRKTNCANLYKKDAFLCDRQCKRKKSCKQHKCFIICCEAKNINDSRGVHLCLNVCGKQLPCNSHKCELFCHIGNCQPCPIIVNQPITCVCGRTSLRSGLPCGTKRPVCTFPCSRVRPCGHPCSLECHEDECPPCTYPVDKQCRCVRETIKDVYCSREALCGKPCEKLLSCGHTCAEICHIDKCLYEGSEEGCKKKCGKIRADCAHICMLPCHPYQEKCPDEPCKVGIKIHCKCLQRETFVECHGSKDKSLKCDSVCANIQRFGILRDQENNKKPYFPPLLIKFAKLQNPFLLKLESKIEDMVKTGKQSADIPISASDTLKRYALQILLSRHYLMELDFYTYFKNPFVCIKTTSNMIFPKPKLSEYLKKMEKGEIKFDVSPFEVTLKFTNLTRGDTVEELETILKEFAQDYYLERINDKTLYIHFWEKDCAERASKKLKRSVTVFSTHLMENNNKVEQEQTRLEDIVYDIVDKNADREREEQRARQMMNEKLKELQKNKQEFPSLGGNTEVSEDEDEDEEREYSDQEEEEKY